MRRLCVPITAFFVLIVFQLSAQTVKISGVVTSSEDNSPLQGVSVVVVGSALGAVTNAEGRYEITVSNLAKQLRFSFVGYKV